MLRLIFSAMVVLAMAEPLRADDDGTQAAPALVPLSAFEKPDYLKAPAPEALKLRDFTQLERAVTSMKPTVGLTGEALRRTRIENMYEAFLDIKGLSENLRVLQSGELTDAVRKQISQETKLLRVRKVELRREAAHFKPEERIADVQESYSGRTRVVVVTFVNRKQLKVEQPQRDAR